MTTHDDVKGYNPKERKCYLQTERRLRFYKVYSKTHCERECASNFMVHKCQCAFFYLPRTANTIICATEDDIACISREFANATKVFDDCRCLPACTTLKYDGHTIKADFEWDKYSDDDTLAFPKPRFGDALSHVKVFFTDMHFIPNVRQQNEFYGLTDFLASCGGLLSLFNGFSIISLVEIVYYATIRLWCHVYRARHRRTADVADASQDVEKQKETEA